MPAQRWSEHGAKPTHQLVTSHLRFVGKIVMCYRGYGPPMSEMALEGNVRLTPADTVRVRIWTPHSSRAIWISG
jgi:DNA-directed RNA polymerase sigma subunit (sigma70/sigma32)